VPAHRTRLPLLPPRCAPAQAVARARSRRARTDAAITHRPRPLILQLLPHHGAPSWRQERLRLPGRAASAPGLRLRALQQPGRRGGRDRGAERPARRQQEAQGEWESAGPRGRSSHVAELQGRVLLAPARPHAALPACCSRSGRQPAVRTPPPCRPYGHGSITDAAGSSTPAAPPLLTASPHCIFPRWRRCRR
jgi:hypothetical protein